MRQEDRFSIVVSSSRRPRRVDYIIDSSSFHGCSSVRAWRPFLRPGLRVQTGRAQGVVKAGRRAGLPLASMLPGHALTEAQQVLHTRCNWPLTSALPVTPDDSVDKKRSKHYRRRFVSLACLNEPAAPPRSYLLLEIARVVGLTRCLRAMSVGGKTRGRTNAGERVQWAEMRWALCGRGALTTRAG
jgi:hypothetical protein